jgi:hypothetical protein
MNWSTVKCQLRLVKAPRHNARECCIAVEDGEWLAVLWMVMKAGFSLREPRLCRELEGMIRTLMFASLANRATER